MRGRDGGVCVAAFAVGPLKCPDQNIDFLQHDLPVDPALGDGGEELESALDAPR